MAMSPCHYHFHVLQMVTPMGSQNASAVSGQQMMSGNQPMMSPTSQQMPLQMTPPNQMQQTQHMMGPSPGQHQMRPTSLQHMMHPQGHMGQSQPPTSQHHMVGDLKPQPPTSHHMVGDLKHSTIDFLEPLFVHYLVAILTVLSLVSGFMLAMVEPWKFLFQSGMQQQQSLTGPPMSPLEKIAKEIEGVTSHVQHLTNAPHPHPPEHQVGQFQLRIRSVNHRVK